LSIAEACNLPRETVRRKVVHLIERGFVYRSAEGHLFLAHDVGEHFEDMTAQIVEHLLSTAATLQALLQEQQQRQGPTGGRNADAVRVATAA
jgi:predicted transcriptional regulator